ncbi:MAG: phosphotransferase, partial [Rhodothermales bacterium]
RGLYVASADAELRNVTAQSARLLEGEQSNSAAIVDDKYFVKLYRRLDRGTNPETELLEYLTRAEFKFTPRLHGRVTFTTNQQPHAMGVLLDALPVQSDGWNYALQVMNRFLDRVHEMSPRPFSPPEAHAVDVPGWLEDVAPEILSLARVLGIRTAELHLALSRAEDPDMRPIEGTSEDVTNLVERIREEASETRQMLAQHSDKLVDLPRPAEWEAAFRRLDLLSGRDPGQKRIRVHGDYHLGQVLLADGEFYILDFEGEPARVLEERRKRDFALRDVAGMLRSLEYAALGAYAQRKDEDGRLGEWTRRLIKWCETIFQNAYFDIAESGDFVATGKDRPLFMWAYLLDKALYEIRYELNHRPGWTWLPLQGLKRLLVEARHDLVEKDAELEESRDDYSGLIRN